MEDSTKLRLFMLAAIIISLILVSCIINIDTIKKAWKNKWSILEGLWNNLFPTEYVERVAAERMSVCEQCPEIDVVGTKCALPGSQPCCGNCSCKLSWKVRVLSESCPLKKWEEEMTEDEYSAFKIKHGLKEEE